MSQPNDTRGHWLQWAILLTLRERHGRTSIVAARVKNAGWSVFAHFYTNPRTAVYRALRKLEEAQKVERSLHGNENHWSLTRLGQAFVDDFLSGNPHITPEKSQERFA